MRLAAFICGSHGGMVSYDQSGACEVDIRYMSFCPTPSKRAPGPPLSLAELSAVEAPGSSVGSAGRAAAPLPSVLLDLWLRQKQPSGDLITPHAGNLTAPMRDETGFWKRSAQFVETQCGAAAAR